jgi:mono/diheme cytochrome c family protein
MSRILHFCSFPTCVHVWSEATSDPCVAGHPVSSLKRCALCGSTAIVNSLAFHPDAHPKRIERGTSRLHVKFKVLGLPVDTTAGNSDLTPLWNMQQHQGFAYHWDGLQTSLHEAVISGAFGNGATKKSLPLANLARIEAYINQLQPPAYPAAIDRALATQGEPIFQVNCATCHAFGNTQTGQVLNNGDTDPQRLTVWSQAAADAYNAFGDGETWDLKNFRKTNGYVSPSLDGIWLRAPYLHNGSVPTLSDLLNPPSSRSTTFYRGYDLYDVDRGGFVATGAAAQKVGTIYDTQVSGNSNQGHLYGTDLSADQKKALLEYLKTL